MENPKIRGCAARTTSVVSARRYGGFVPIRVLLADDHDMVREALRRVIESRGDISVVAEAHDGREAVAAARLHKPDVAVIDLWMPGISGEEATRQIVESGCGARVLALSMHEDWARVRSALQAGALGYVVKSAAASQLIEAIHALRAGRAYLSPAVAHHVVEAVGHADTARSPISQLTEREREVLALIAEGLSSKEIAAHLGHSPKTAETHRASLMRKLGVHKTSSLVRIAIREGLVVP
jgi:DNA-binding NarL/FixJ family response regulator